MLWFFLPNEPPTGSDLPGEKTRRPPVFCPFPPAQPPPPPGEESALKQAMKLNCRYYYPDTNEKRLYLL
jgi:hypothetical protein